MKNLVFLFSILSVLVVKANNEGKLKRKDLFDTLKTNISGNGIDMQFVFEKGKSFNHPTFVIWIEDMNGQLIQNLFVTKSFAKGIFDHGPINDSVWGNEPGEAYRPAALPYWNHKRISQPSVQKIVPTIGNPIPDAYSGATPTGSFVLKAKTNNKVKGKIKVLLEINQTWDWNEYWTNNKYPGNHHYKSSSQPSLIYYVEIDYDNLLDEYWLNPIGHGHYAGEDGNLYSNLTTITSALEIVKSIKLIVGKN